MPKSNPEVPTFVTDEEMEAILAEAGVDAEGLVEEQTGFPPYWKPEIGKWFKATVMRKDTRDENFIRYELMALKAVICAKGPADDAEEIIVNEGEFFTCSTYATLPLDTYFGLDVMVITHKTQKLKGNEASRGVPRDLFHFKVLVTTDTKNLLDLGRKQDAKLLREMARQKRLDLIKLGSGEKRPNSTKSVEA